MRRPGPDGPGRDPPGQRPDDQTAGHPTPADAEVVRAQTAKETYWFQRNVGDFTTETSRCVCMMPIDSGHSPPRPSEPSSCPGEEWLGDYDDRIWERESFIAYAG